MFFAMLSFPVAQKIRPVCQAAHYAIDVLLGHGLKDDAAELVLQQPDLGAGLDPMLASKLDRNYKLALGRKCSTFFLHGLQRITGKKAMIKVIPMMHDAERSVLAPGRTDSRPWTITKSAAIWRTVRSGKRRCRLCDAGFRAGIQDRRGFQAWRW